MRMKLLVIIVLTGAVLYSSIAGTLSSYTTSSAFGASIVPDPVKVRRQADDLKESEQPGTHTGQDEASDR